MAAVTSENRSRWKQLIEDQQNSGLSVPKFCLERNLKTHQLIYYKSVLFQKKTKKSSFVKVQTKEPVLTNSKVTLAFKDISICLEGHHDPEVILNLCRLFAVLG